MRTLLRGDAQPTNGALLARAPLVISLLALFFALGGTGWAGQVLGHGSVGTAQLARDSVTTPKIAAGAVTKSKLATGAVTSSALGPARSGEMRSRRRHHCRPTCARTARRSLGNQDPDRGLASRIPAQ